MAGEAGTGCCVVFPAAGSLSNASGAKDSTGGIRGGVQAGGGGKGGSGGEASATTGASAAGASGSG